MVAFFLLLDAASWLAAHGGVFSLLSAASSLTARPPSLDIDKNGLLFPFLLLVWIAVVALCRVTNARLDVTNRQLTFLFVISVIVGGFVLSAVCGEPIITRFMSGHGYSRCEAHDHAHGNGKGRVWFANYVLNKEDCPGPAGLAGMPWRANAYRA
jgi:hypothetical protein